MQLSCTGYMNYLTKFPKNRIVRISVHLSCIEYFNYPTAFLEVRIVDISFHLSCTRYFNRPAVFLECRTVGISFHLSCTRYFIHPAAFLEGRTDGILAICHAQDISSIPQYFLKVVQSVFKQSIMHSLSHGISWSSTPWHLNTSAIHRLSQLSPTAR